MNKICNFILSFCLIYLIKCQNQNIKNEDEEEEEMENLNLTSNIININYIEQFEDYLNQGFNKILVIEIYNKDCIHCKEFFPKYYNLSLMFKPLEDFIFIKIEGKVYNIIVNKYSEIKTKGVPSLFIYNSNKFIKYNGFMNIENIYSFLIEKYEFDCKEINEGEYFNNFIEDKIKFSKQRKSNYILGIFNKNEINIDNIINKFKFLNFRNKDIIQVDTCFYFLYDNNKYIINFEIQDFLFEHSKNSIMIYNNQKGINTFNLIDFKKFNESLNSNYSINFDNLYRNFLLKNYLSLILNIQSYQIENLYYLPQNSFIFSYKTIEEQKYFKSLIKEITSYSIYNNDYILILLDISKKIKLKKTLSLTKNTGIYFFEPGLQNERIVIEKNNETNLENNFPVQIVLKYIKLEKQGNLPLSKSDEDEIKLIKLIENMKKEFNEKFADFKKRTFKNNSLNYSNQTNNNRNNNNTIKIDKKKKIIKEQTFLETEQNIELETKNIKKLILLPLYFIIYSILFIWLYKKYISKIDIKFLKELKEVKAI